MKKVGIVGHFGFGHDLLNGQTIKVKILFQEFQKQLGAENTMAVDTHGGWFCRRIRACCFLRRCFRYLIKSITVEHIILLLAVGLTVIWISISGLKNSSRIIQQSV